VTGKPKGYAFVEFKHEDDMKKAYRNASHMKIDGKRIVVDCERGRTVTEWKPRKLGGGLGSTRAIGARPSYYDKPSSHREEYRPSGMRRASDRDDHHRRDSRDRDQGSYRSSRQDERPRDDRRSYGGDRDSDRKRSYGSSRYDDRR
jgi:U1 small nuclear ribonucleoprotein